MAQTNTKTFLITGVSSGFGRALAQAALRNRHIVVGTVRQAVARMSEAISGTFDHTHSTIRPAYRFAHAGYTINA